MEAKSRKQVGPRDRSLLQDLLLADRRQENELKLERMKPGVGRTVKHV